MLSARPEEIRPLSAASDSNFRIAGTGSRDNAKVVLLENIYEP
jgi:hypothetical protein